MILLLKTKSNTRNDYFIDGISNINVYDGFFLVGNMVYFKNALAEGENKYDLFVEEAYKLYDCVFSFDSCMTSKVKDTSGNELEGYYATIIEYTVGDVMHNIIFNEHISVYLCNNDGKTIDVINS